MQRELVELKEFRDATLEVAKAMDILVRDGDEPLTLAGRLCRVPGAFEKFVSHITRQYVGHVLGLVKSYWPTTRLDALGRGAKLIVLTISSVSTWRKLPGWLIRL